jgi:hypothetical protein
MKSQFYSLTLVGIVLALIGGAMPSRSVAQEMYLTHPSSCVAPYLAQAELMRWHENFLLNPSSGVRTWVICPIDMYVSDFVVPQGNWLTQVFLQKSVDASPQAPLCYFTVHSVINQQWGGFISGPSHKYTTPLQNLTSGEITVAQTTVTPTEIFQALGAGVESYPFHVSVFCRLDPGWGLSGVELIEVPQQ